MQFINLNFVGTTNNRKRKTKGIQPHKMQHERLTLTCWKLKDAVCIKCKKQGLFAEFCKSKFVAAAEQ